MTMGQRIAERRRLLGLTQEGLGERLGVSRQAISKWEADAATPEIDKLIAMSKLFSVSVGWLLGTEELAAPEQAESFSEEQLKMVEEIVKRYRQPERKSRHVILAIGFIVLALALVIFGIRSYVNLQVDGLHAQISSLYSYYSNIYGQLGDVSSRLEEMAAGERLLSEYKLEAEPWDDWSGATVRFTAIPKTTQAGDQAWLSVRLEGREVASAMCSMDGAAYTASVELPAANGYSYYFQAVHTGGDSTLERLEDADVICQNLNVALQGWAFARASKCEWEKDLLQVKVSVERSDPYLLPTGANTQWAQMDLVLLRNGMEADRMSVLEHFSSEVFIGEDDIIIEADPDYVSFVYWHDLPDLTEDDELVLQLEYRYTNQNAVVKQRFLVLYLEDGVLRADHYTMKIQ